MGRRSKTLKLQYHPPPTRPSLAQPRIPEILCLMSSAPSASAATSVKGLYPSFVSLPLRIPSRCVSRSSVLGALNKGCSVGSWRWCGDSGEEGGDGTPTNKEDQRRPSSYDSDEDSDSDSNLHVSLHWMPLFVAFTSVRPFLSALRLILSSLGADAVVATVTDDLEVFVGGGRRTCPYQPGRRVGRRSCLYPPERLYLPRRSRRRG